MRHSALEMHESLSCGGPMGAASAGAASWCPRRWQDGGTGVRRGKLGERLIGGAQGRGAAAPFGFSHSVSECRMAPLLPSGV
jgi:hypothetical protein